MEENKMSIDRATQLINNLLNEIVTKAWDSPSEDYIPWLVEEVGFTKEEIDNLKVTGHLPMPIDLDVER